MLMKTRRRLTAIFTAITGSILAAVLCISMWYSVQQAKITSSKDFSADAGYISITLSGGSQTQTSWLTEIERKNQYVISVKEDGTPIEFQSGWTPRTAREAVIREAEKTIASESVVYSISSASLAGTFSTKTAARIPEDAFIVRGNTISGEAENLEGSITVTVEEKADSGVLEASGTDNFAAIINPEIFFNEMTGTVQKTEPVYVSIGMASEAADASGISLYSVSAASPYPEFSGENGDEYRINSLAFAGADDKIYDLMIIEDLQKEKRSILFVCLGYGILLFIGTALLTAVNWFLSRLVLKPVSESISRQTEFVAAASHELRSPLAVLCSSLAAADSSETKEETDKYHLSAEREAKRMSRLIDDLLILAGGDSKSWDIQSGRFDADTLLIETHEQYEPLAKEKQLRLLLDLPEETLGDLTGDKDRIRQILSVLLDNALEYAPAGTAVTLAAGYRKNKLCLSVSDEGPGIPDADKKKIFDRFYRADKSRTDKAHFGLGLAVAKELARLHGGTLSVKDNDGHGAVFILKLPLKITEE